MNSICGVIYKNGKPVQDMQVEVMLTVLSHWKPDVRAILTDSNTGFGCIYSGRDIMQKSSLILRLQHIVVIADARIDNKKELCELLACNTNASDQEFIGNAYLKWGKRCAEHLTGDFVFVIWDRKTETLYCARDHMGVRPFFYYEDNEKFVFASEIKGVRAVESVMVVPREEWIADTVATIISEANVTFYDRIFRLQPAHYMVLEKNDIRIKQYWDLDLDKEIRYKKETDYYDGLKELLIESVKCRTGSDVPLASELSGGLDSSAVTAIAFDILGGNSEALYAYSHALPDHATGKIFPFKDEREYSDLLCDYKGINNHIYVTSEDKTFVKETEYFLEVLDELFQQRLALFSDNLYEMAAANGCRTLLSGFGGDQLVTYAGAGYFEELAHQWKFRKLMSELKSGTYKKPYRKFAGLMMKEFTPFIYRLRSKDNEWAIERYVNLLIDRRFSEKMGVAKRYKDVVGFPLDKSLKKRQYQRVFHQHVPGRLENCNITAKHYGLEYVYPLLDKRLMELYFSYPVDIKYKNGIGRYAFRKAVESIVPETIQWRKDKTGATVPTVQQRFLKDAEIMRQLIIESKTVNREHYVDYEKTLAYLEKMISRSNAQNWVNPGVFFDAVSVLIYQKMSRDGKL